jgi:hypothetical protein
MDDIQYSTGTSKWRIDGGHQWWHHLNSLAFF